MNTSQMTALYDQDQRKDVEYPDMRREVTPNVVRHIDTSGARGGTVIYSQVNEANADDADADHCCNSCVSSVLWKGYISMLSTELA